MLVLSRKLGESIQISDDITVTISRVSRGRVRLSIEAPRSVKVARSEIVATDSGSCETDQPVAG